MTGVISAQPARVDLERALDRYQAQNPRSRAHSWRMPARSFFAARLEFVDRGLDVEVFVQDRGQHGRVHGRGVDAPTHSHSLGGTERGAATSVDPFGSSYRCGYTRAEVGLPV